MLINVVGATGVVFLPSVAAKFAKQDAWMTTGISTIPGIVVVLLVTELYRKFPGKTIIEYSQFILGDWIGKVVGVLYLFFFIHTNAIIIREFSELVLSMLMPRTPLIVFHLIFVILAAYAVHSGLEVIGRVLEFTFPWVLILYTALLLFGLEVAEFNKLFPMLENGIKPVLLGSITPSAWRGKVVLLAMYLPHLAKSGNGRILGIWSMIILVQDGLNKYPTEYVFRK